jgi:hypothetical protein
MFEKYKPAIITLSIIALIAAGIVNYVKDLIDEPIEAAPEHLQVKAPAEKILHSQKIKDEQGNDIVKYLYASETEAPAETIKIDEQEIKEDISKRTKNAQFFKKRGLHSGEGLWSQDADTQEGSIASVAAGDNGAVAANEGEKEVWVGRFYAGEPFYKDAAENKWYQTETSTTTAEEFAKQTKPNFLARVKAFFSMNALADTGSYYAGAGDGTVRYWVAATWATARDATTGTAASYTVAALSEAMGARKVLATNWRVDRAFFPIDTSGIADTDTITDATLTFYISTFGAFDTDSTSWEVVQTSQPSTSALTTADFDALTFTSGGSLALSASEGGEYVHITLNSTGKGWISKTDWTKLGVILGRDLTNTAPTGNNSSDIYFSEQTGTSQDPYLEVTYTVPAAPAKFRFDGGQMKIKGKVKFE